MNTPGNSSYQVHKRKARDAKGQGELGNYSLYTQTELVVGLILITTIHIKAISNTELLKEGAAAPLIFCVETSYSEKSHSFLITFSVCSYITFWNRKRYTLNSEAVFPLHHLAHVVKCWKKHAHIYCTAYMAPGCAVDLAEKPPCPR